VLDVPGPVAHLWTWFWQLDQGRQSSGYGPQALSPGEIEGWARLYRQEPRPWEIEAIMAMDTSRRAALRPPDPAGENTGLRRMVSAHDTKAAMALLDSMDRRED
jgi:hypothetical protein